MKKLCPPKLSNAIRTPLINDARELLNNVTVANSLDIRIEWQRAKRRDLQVGALQRIIMLTNDLLVCIKIAGSEKGFIGAFQLMNDERRLLKAWIRSDDTRVEKMKADENKEMIVIDEFDQLTTAITPGVIPGTDINVLEQQDDSQNSNVLKVNLGNDAQTVLSGANRIDISEIAGVETDITPANDCIEQLSI